MSAHGYRKRLAVLGWLILANPLLSASEEPLPTGEVERVDVDYVVIDVAVVDDNGRGIADLTIDDFEVIADGKLVELASLDVACRPRQPETPAGSVVADPFGPDPKIVLAFDYLHLDPTQRMDALEQAKWLVNRGRCGGLETMLVALPGGLRIEQAFASDADDLVDSLQKMQRDPTLANPDFYHQNSFVFEHGLMALFDVLDGEPGHKAVVLFSAMKDVPLDSQFERIAARAAASRTAIYPVDVRGLVPREFTEVTQADLRREATDRLGVDPVREFQQIRQKLQPT